jgi:4-diphosphocytidyl-2-C-methyl-D-erythritol kinase
MASSAVRGRYDQIIVTAVTARVPAKVNLQLSVGPPRADGYHDLVTVFHALALFDEVTVAPAETDSVRVSGEGAASVPLGGDNLAARAVAALTDAVGAGCRDEPGLAIEIRKRIPVAAGLAGGSADAAAALVACNELWGTGLSQQELAEVAGRVGSDVAFALLGGTAIGLGRGEQVTPALVSGTYHWVLAFAAEQLSTAAVYAACDRLRAAQLRDGAAAAGQQPPTSGTAQPPAGTAVQQQPAGTAAGQHPAGTAAGQHPAGTAAGQHPAGTAPQQPLTGPPQAESAAGHPGRPPDPARPAPGQPAGGSWPTPELSTALMAALRSGDPAEVGPLLVNDLQPAAISLLPGLRRALAAGREHGALGAIVSGSGPTCAYLARDGAHARDLAVALTSTGVCRSVVSVTGPAPGATVLSPAADRRR